MIYKICKRIFFVLVILTAVEELSKIAINTHKVMEELREMNRILRNSQS